MTKRRLTIVSLWIVSVFLVGAALSAQGRVNPFSPAALSRQHRVNPFSLAVLGTVMSGDDLGFRVGAVENGVPKGILVVRVEGEWVDVALFRE